jgi:hypothetical protein
MMNALLIAKAQQNAQLIISSWRQTDYTFHRKDDLVLKVNTSINMIVYEFDSVNQTAKTTRYFIGKGNSRSSDADGAPKIREHYQLWSHRVPANEFKNLLKLFETNVDTLNKTRTMLHTSHYFLKIGVTIIQGSDTSSFMKFQPFEYDTPWYGNNDASLLNPEIDQQIAALLPPKFVGRDKLLLTSKKLNEGN